MTLASPIPLTIPILAHMNSTAVIIGKVASAVQRIENPSDAPATAYVPMPEGSSSDAPVIRPGPRIFRNRLRGFRSRSVADSGGQAGPAASLFRSCFILLPLDVQPHGKHIRRP